MITTQDVYELFTVSQNDKISVEPLAYTDTCRVWLIQCAKNAVLHIPESVDKIGNCIVIEHNIVSLTVIDTIHPKMEIPKIKRITHK